LNLASGLGEVSEIPRALNLSAGLVHDHDSSSVQAISLKAGLHRAVSAEEGEFDEAIISPTKLKNILATGDFALEVEAWEVKVEKNKDEKENEVIVDAQDVMKSLGFEGNEVIEDEKWESKRDTKDSSSAVESDILNLLGVSVEEFKSDKETWTRKASISHPNVEI
jgi:hypothetical protein